jgi:hypothetical protein
MIGILGIRGVIPLNCFPTICRHIGLIKTVPGQLAALPVEAAQLYVCDRLVDCQFHLRRREVLEPRPAEVVVRPALGVLARRKDAALDRLLEPGGLVFFERVQVVEPLEEEQVSDLLDDLQLVGDAAGSEGVPDAVDLVADVAGEHGRTLW